MVRNDQPEWRLSHYVNSLLEKIITEPAWFTAVDTGTQMVHKTQEARFAAEARRKARGQKRQMDADAKEAARLTRNERERMRRAAKRQQAMEAA